MADNDREGTGKKPASDAGKLLSDPESPEDVKDVAASDLAQVKPARRRASDYGRPGPVTRAASRCRRPA